ncbi:RIP metalloprotease RseP [Pseudochelatococcus contaminans]|uniref:Zinc metalloprotease n=1 Tax=Pseudochelatococcus contaminans TaxID=1538103 RepID=A0A7W5Z4A6_9HYPH|nr:RIP metalloprotease RseP [Pseudochelatococcus contaminans]MBB3809906.1 regulator of sigma E protease [Pseudochelatococcus contaminans]
MDLFGGLLGLGGAVTGLASTLVAFLFVLTLVVFVHEYGHFIVARWCGVKVKVFSIGFGKELFGWYDRQGTRWRFSAIPLGGYVKFEGDANAASVPDYDAVKSMTAAEREGSIFHKSVGQRAAIVAAGPAANFLMAIVVFSAMAYFNGRQILLPRIETIQPASAAEKAGFQTGDLVISIDGRTIDSFTDMQRIVSMNAGETLNIVVDRGGVQVELQASPELREVTSPLGSHRVGVLGVQASGDRSSWRTESYSLPGALQAGAGETWQVVAQTYHYLGRLFTGKETTDQLSGPIRIAEVSGQVARLGGLTGLLSLAALLSVSIGLVNLIPIPMLDGGHLLFYAIEAIRGKPLSERAQEFGFKIGLAFVLMMMLLVTWNDLAHIGGRLSVGQ